jgi:hypothetical protein
MFYFFTTHTKKEIRLLMFALEHYEEHGCPVNQRPIVHALYEKVRAAYFSSPADAHARARSGETVSVHDLTFIQRLKFLFGSF